MTDIDLLIIESTDNVCVRIENYIDKINRMIEYNASDEYIDDFVMEAFEIYLEASNRRKNADEIDQYIRDKKLGDVNSSISHKAKRARQLRNFLIQHDFDPKTETIKSDVSGKRVGFRIDIRNKNRSEYSPVGDYINMGINKFNNQRSPQIIISHEKGHHLFNETGKSSKWGFIEDKNERGIKHLDEAKAKGKQINSHDDGMYIFNDKQSPEELEADLHAAKTARVRTKYAGRKRAVKRSGATRNVNDNEIKKYFEDMYVSFKKCSIDKKFNTIKNSIKYNNFKLNAKDSDKSFKRAILFIKNIGDIRDSSELKITLLIDHLKQIIDYMGKHDKKADELFISSREIHEIELDIEYQKEHIAELDKLLDSNNTVEKDKIYYTKKLESSIKELKSALIQYEKTVKLLASEDGNYKINVNFIDKVATLYTLLIEYKSDIGLVYSKVHTLISDIKSDINEIDSTYLKDDIMMSPESKIIMLKKVQNDYIEALQKLRSSSIDDSTQMRYDFVKKYVHEFFEDYYSLENLGIYLEEVIYDAE